MKYILKLSVILLALFGSNLNAFSLNHVEYMSSAYTQNISKKDVLRVYKELRNQSKGLSFLDCPINLIEQQYNGIESVLVGTKFLNIYFSHNNLSIKEYKNLIIECENTLRKYQEDTRQKVVQPREVTQDEIQTFINTMTSDKASNQLGVGSLVLNSINQSTVCYARRTAFEASYFIGGSMGSTAAECFTPMGRHFLFIGPSIGYGVGFMGAVVLPNPRVLPTVPNWSFKLYEQKSTRFFHEHHNRVQAGLGVGATSEFKNSKSSPKKFKKEANALAGWGAMAEHTHNLLFYVPLRSLYFSLSKAVDLNYLTGKISNALRAK